MDDDADGEQQQADHELKREQDRRFDGDEHDRRQQQDGAAQPLDPNQVLD